MASTQSDPDEIDVNLTHAKAGYTNAQEVIRFIDSKTGIMTGVLTVTTSIPIAIFHSILSGSSNEVAMIVAWTRQGGASQWLVWLCAFFMIVGFALGIVSLIAATSGLMARRPLKSVRDDSLLKEIGRLILKTLTFGKKGEASGERPAEVTCLFPFFGPKQQTEASKRFHKLGTSSYSKADVLREYAMQLESVGSILETKISRNRKTIQCFEGQIVAYAISTLLAVALFASHFPTEKRDRWDPTLPGHAILKRACFMA